VNPQQRVTAVRALSGVVVFCLMQAAAYLFNSWTVSVLAVALFTLYSIFVEIKGAEMDADATISELFWILWARQPWIFWLVSVLGFNVLGYIELARFHYDREQLLYSLVKAALMFFCGHFVAQASDKYDALRKVVTQTVRSETVQAGQVSSTVTTVQTGPLPVREAVQNGSTVRAIQNVVSMSSLLIMALLLSGCNFLKNIHLPPEPQPSPSPVVSPSPCPPGYVMGVHGWCETCPGGPQFMDKTMHCQYPDPPCDCKLGLIQKDGKCWYSGEQCPSPAPSPSPTPSPTPVPSPIATPAPAACAPPLVNQDAWELINDGCDGARCPNPDSKTHEDGSPVVVIDAQAANMFEGQRVKIVADTVRAMESLSGCNDGDFPCLTQLPYQTAQANLAAKMSALGYCAGQDQPGESDHIYVSTNPPLLSLWLEVHAVAGNAAGDIWCWGCVRGSSRTPGSVALWRVKGGATPLPSPGPTPVPTPTPRPTPVPQPEPAHDGVWSATITVSTNQAHPGDTVTWTCHPRDKQGREISVPADAAFAGAHIGSPLGGHIATSHDDLSATVHIDRSAPSGELIGNCAWYGTPGVFAPPHGNLAVQVISK